MTRRQSRLAIVVGVLLVLALVRLPVPFVALQPGPTFNTLGVYDGKKVVKITGTTTYPTAGTLSMVTVSEAGGPYGFVSLGAAIHAWLSPTSAVVPTYTLYPTMTNPGQAVEEGRVAFTSSQNDAVAAATSFLHIKTTNKVMVNAVVVGSPASGVYKPDDQIIAVDGTPVHNAAESVALIRSHKVGDQVTSTVIRKGKTLERTTTTRALSPKHPNVPYVGLDIADVVVPPFNITFNLSDIGGPSAGNMFALGIVDQLTPGQLNGGKAIAGTGTIDPLGNVGPIGGVVQKVAAAQRDGAKLFLLPLSNCPDLKYIPSGITTTPVKTLAQSVAVIHTWATGGHVPSCPATPKK